jgi:bla regulator protein BlaR1
MRLRSALFLLLASLSIGTPLATAQDYDDINPAAKAIARAARLPAYDVVSIHQHRSDSGDSSLDTTQDGIVIENAPLREIVEFAYSLASFDLISGISGPVAFARFDIRAKIVTADGDRPVKLTDDDLQAMTISVLTDRFHLHVHVVPKRMTVYELVVAKGGPKFKLNEPDASSLNASWGKDNILNFQKSSMPTLAGVLSDSGLHGLVVDRTGLKGAGDFSLKWSSDEAQEQGGRDVISVFTAVRYQLGLKLQPTKLPVDTLVIDHVEMPSGN